MKNPLLSIKNAEPYLLFNVLPTTQTQMKSFFGKMIAVSRHEAETVIADYEGFDFETMREKDEDRYNDNIAYLEKFNDRLSAINNIEQYLTKINFHLNTLEFCSIYNALFPYMYEVIDGYVNFDFETQAKDSPDFYDENVNYLNLYKRRVDEILEGVKAKDPLFQIAGNERIDDVYKYTDLRQSDRDEIDQLIMAKLSPEQVSRSTVTQALRSLVSLGPIFVKCIKAVERKKSVVCSQNENYFVLVTPGFYSSPKVFIIDDEGEAKVLDEIHYSHFDFTPLDNDEDKSEAFYKLEAKAQLEWCKSVEFQIKKSERAFKHQDLVQWAEGCKDVTSAIDYDMPMYVYEVDEENRSVKVICNLHTGNRMEKTGAYRPLPSLSEGHVVIETIPVFRLTEYY